MLLIARHKCFTCRGVNSQPSEATQGVRGGGRKSLEVNVFQLEVWFPPDSITLGPCEKSTRLFFFCLSQKTFVKQTSLGPSCPIRSSLPASSCWECFADITDISREETDLGAYELWCSWLQATFVRGTNQWSRLNQPEIRGFEPFLDGRRHSVKKSRENISKSSPVYFKKPQLQRIPAGAEKEGPVHADFQKDPHTKVKVAGTSVSQNPTEVFTYIVELG